MKLIDKAIKKMGGKKLNRYEIEEIKRLWEPLRRQIRRGVYAQVNTVAASGMSRTISVYILYKKEMINLNYTPFWKLYGDNRKNGIVRISGCGMDMLFEASYRLFCSCFDSSNFHYQDHLGRYKDI
ncbi:MAG: hypothetical protein JRJ39_00350 [Deltaproteobacteria bacterium]|nr:hypothetical protein [Deltaproteobacteria bacterium]MBW1845558.1 hypothetical protein [Deltaproteobacteria bacterium]MBW2031988.1 hypothetical protein [Deltaproteobacteria bacterium]